MEARKRKINFYFKEKILGVERLKEVHDKKCGLLDCINNSMNQEALKNISDSTYLKTFQSLNVYLKILSDTPIKN